VLCRKIQLFNLFSDIVALKYVKIRLKVEKFRPDVEEVIGTVGVTICVLQKVVRICVS